MAEDPVRHQYHPDDRAEVFDLLRVSLPAETSARVIAQWAWKYEANPFNPPEGPEVYVMRIGSKLVSLIAAFRVPLWIAGTQCMAEHRGEWVVHPNYRRQKLWQRVNFRHAIELPILFAWAGEISARAATGGRWTADPLTPLLRVLDAGPFLEHFTHSRRLASIGTGASAAARVAGARLRRLRSRHSGARVRLDAFDDSVDALWERARRDQQAMVVRDHRYLNWRYCQRPDATYMLYGVERGSELAGFLVARASMHQGMRWGYLVDFLAAENSGDVLSSLIEEALDEFRGLGVAAVSCYATDPTIRRTLFRHGLFPVPQHDPHYFIRRIHQDRSDLQRFAQLRQWYVTMGDGDLEMSF